MASVQLLDASGTNGAGTGQSVTGPCTVHAYGTFAGATCTIQISKVDTAANYANADRVSKINPAVLNDQGSVTINAYGTYYLRTVLANCNTTGTTSITVYAEN